MNKTLLLAGLMASMVSPQGPNPFGPVVPKKPVYTGPHPNTDNEPLGGQRGWGALEEYTFDEYGFAEYHIDTRDFHVSTRTSFQPLEELLDMRKVKKHPLNYLHTAQEVKELMAALKANTGGNTPWREFSLMGVMRSQNWLLKYIRIYRYRGVDPEHQLLICNKENFIFNRHDIRQPLARCRAVTVAPSEGGEA